MPKEVIHTYQKFGTTIKFSIDEKGILFAQVADESQKREIPFINGLPAELRSGLLDEAKKTHLKRILEDSYFVTIGPEIQVNARLRGGWGDEVHMGYSMESDGTVKGKTKVSTSVGELEVVGTYGWAKETGFVETWARVIAAACAETDRGELGPMPWQSQHIHFNFNEDVGDGHERDTRIQYAGEQLHKAINLYTTGKTTWADELGRGLHALQDVFAHTNEFVTTLEKWEMSFAWYIPWVSKNKYKTHVGLPGTEEATRGEGADDVGYTDPNPPNPAVPPKRSPASFVQGEREFNQRYSDTKTATYLYLAIFLCSTTYQDGTHTTDVQRLCDLIRGSGAKLRIKCDSAEKNAHKFHGLLAKFATDGAEVIIVPPTIRALFFPPDLPSPITTSMELLIKIGGHRHHAAQCCQIYLGGNRIAEVWRGMGDNCHYDGFQRGMLRKLHEVLSGDRVTVSSYSEAYAILSRLAGQPPFYSEPLHDASRAALMEIQIHYNREQAELKTREERRPGL